VLHAPGHPRAHQHWTNTGLHRIIWQPCWTVFAAFATARIYGQALAFDRSEAAKFIEQAEKFGSPRPRPLRTPGRL